MPFRTSLLRRANVVAELIAFQRISPQFGKGFYGDYNKNPMLPV